MKRLIHSVFTKINQSARPQICENTANWAKEHNFPSFVIGSSVIDEVIDHLGLDVAIGEEYKKTVNLLSRDQYLVCIENAIIRDEIGFLELPDKRLCVEGNWYTKHLKEHPAYSRRFNYQKRYLKGNWYSLLSLWSPMYYHWFHDVLPRLENAIKYLPDNTRFLINEKPYEYQIKSLEAYGISIDKLEYQSPKLHTKIQNLWFATPVGHEKFGSIKTIKKVVHRIKKHFNINNISRDQNIYISRKNAISRRVVNEKQITNIISSRGYDIYYVDEMTWVKQVELFSNAASIIGPHGGGFTNMIFSNLKTNIHEIAPANHSWPYYQLLSAQLGHSFSRINASTDSSGNRANLIVDIIDLTKSLG